MNIINGLSLNELKLRIVSALKSNRVRRDNRRRNFLLIGFPGIGKSQFIKSISDDIGFDYLSYIPSMGNPTEIKGLGFKTESKGIAKAEFLFYEFMDAIYTAKKPTIVHIEDLIQGTPLMQAAIMSLIEKRSVNNKSIPNHIYFILDTNDASHKAGGNIVLAPLVGRVSAFQYPLDWKAWVAWGLKNDIAKEVLLYIHANPEDLCAKSIPKGIQPFATPRSWERVSDWIHDGFTDATTLASDIGEEIAIKTAAFIKDIQTFGNILPKVKNDPMNAPLYYTTNETYGVLLILANHFSKENVSSITKYFERYDNKELQTVLFELGTTIHPDSKETKEYVSFITSID